MAKKNHKWLTIVAIAMMAMILNLNGNIAGASVKSGGPQSIIIDKHGRRVVVRQPFKRIISLYGAHTENLFALGLDDEIIGVSRHESYPPAALSKPVFSYHEDAEKFLAARPDLVLIRPMIDRGYAHLVAHLERNRITVVSLQPISIEEMFQYWLVLGKLTGRMDIAVEMVEAFKKSAAAFRALTAGISPKKGVYFEAMHKNMKTFTPDAMAIFAMETAGGINVAADAYQVRQTNIAYYGKERIISKAEQIDVYLAQFGAMNKPTIEMIKNEPGFQLIKAVRENQVYIIDEMIVSRPTTRLLKGIQEIGSKLYPIVFSKKSNIDRVTSP